MCLQTCSFAFAKNGSQKPVTETLVLPQTPWSRPSHRWSYVSEHPSSSCADRFLVRKKIALPLRVSSKKSDAFISDAIFILEISA